MSKTVYILGLSAFYHDSAACLLKDGEIVAASAEERHTRKKHDASFPLHAAEFCLKEQGISIQDIDYVAYYEKPILKFDRLLETFIKSAPKGFIPFRMAMKAWLKEKLWVPSVIKKKLNYKGEIKYCKHHESHAASAYFTSAFDESAFLTIDGVGERATTTFGLARNNTLTTLKEMNFPHSLGLFYSAFTYYCGFKVNSGEYKLMGLAPLGQPKYVEKITKHLIQINPDGSYVLNMRYFTYEYSLRMIGKQFSELFGKPPRKEESDIESFYKDVASSVQKVTEEIVLRLAKQVKQETKSENLCLAGGVALNCVANGLLERAKIFKNIWIQPAAGDSGTAIGAALLVWHQYLNKPKLPQEDKLAVHSYLGPSETSEEVEKILKRHKVNFHRPPEDELIPSVAKLLDNKSVVGWFEGRMEFGPRALGNRSIFASPVYQDMQRHLNLKIKMREGFRPFAPIVIREYASDWFEIEGDSKSMLYTYTCKQPEKIPACVHTDNSSRIQTLRKEDNPRVYDLLAEFHTLTDCPVLINTSLNVRGEPIVCTAEDALKCFFNTGMDALVLESYLILKSEQSDTVNLKMNTPYELD